MSAKNEVVVGAVSVVAGQGRASGTGVEASVVLPNCRPAGDLREPVTHIAQTLFAQGISFEVIVVCTEDTETCVHPVADLSFVRVIEAPGAERDEAVEYATGEARGVWVAVADDAQVDPFQVAEGLHRARELSLDEITAPNA
ncbi:hypothetical protein [Actinoplanes sp. NPDC051494]|uniref:hypothetical protein n=1 Tax=Actinoplanes sp. NPDC051494 TaxID=3363907 RepID=UPI00378FCBF1